MCDDAVVRMGLAGPRPQSGRNNDALDHEFRTAPHNSRRRPSSRQTSDSGCGHERLHYVWHTVVDALPLRSVAVIGSCSTPVTRHVSLSKKGFILNEAVWLLINYHRSTVRSRQEAAADPLFDQSDGRTPDVLGRLLDRCLTVRLSRAEHMPLRK